MFFDIGQAGAVRLGIAKAMSLWDRSMRTELKNFGDGKFPSARNALRVHLFSRIFLLMQTTCCTVTPETWSVRSLVRRKLERNTSGSSVKNVLLLCVSAFAASSNIGRARCVVFDRFNLLQFPVLGGATPMENI